MKKKKTYRKSCTANLLQESNLTSEPCFKSVGVIILKSSYMPYYSGKDGKPDSWFLFDSYKRKQNPVIEVQELIPEMSHISHQTYKILHRVA